MSITKYFADYAFCLAKESTDDEYQEMMWYKSCALAYASLPFFLYSVGAVLAWGLPGMYTLMSALIIIPIICSESIAQTWLKDFAPRPRANVNSKFTALTMLPAVLMIAGIVYRLFSVNQDSMAQGAMVGAVAGTAVAAIVTPVVINAVRKKDENRFDSQLDDEE